MERHSHAAGRSRSSQSQSPSHSAASASATSSHRKRKLPPSDDLAPPFPPSSTATFSADTRDGALTSNDDLESISARGGGAEDSDSEDESDVAVDDDEDEYDDSSIRNFTAARLENSGSVSAGAAAASVRNTKIKLDNSVKVETPEAGKDGGGAGAAGTNSAAMVAGGAAGTAPGGTLKENKTVFTENIQNSGAYIAREESLKREEESGSLRFICVSNDGKDEHMVWLIGLKNIFSRQLPNMPKEYIVRLVMDRNHKSVMVIRRKQVVGGITYRPYVSQKFGEIAFCAITADEQVKGYGTRLMNHLKLHARDGDGLTHFLTYADNNAVGYFVKQGFTKEIRLDKDRWHGFIKDYDGGILMECKIDPKLPYTDLSTMIRQQRMAIDEKIKELSFCHKVYSGDKIEKLLKKEDGIPKQAVKVEDIPGLREAGWTPDQYGHSRFKALMNGDGGPNKKSLTAFMRSLLKTMLDHPDVWPFKEPVDPRDVPDYYDIIQDPMDLKTISKRVESEQYYLTLEMFIADAKRMFANARTYNSPETIYYKCSTRLEAHFSSKVQSGLQALTKLPP